MIVLLPGSRTGEAARHLTALGKAADLVRREVNASVGLATPAGVGPGARPGNFREPISRSAIQLIKGETWDAIAHADLALAASGTVTVEAALLGTPMVTFYKVTRLSWWLGRFLVNVPFYSMVNLVAGRKVAPEIMQNEMTGERLARETLRLLNDAQARGKAKQDLAEVAARLAGAGDPMERAARLVQELMVEEISDGG